MRRLLATALTIAVILAGCSGVVQTGSPASTPATPAETPTDTTTSAATATPIATTSLPVTEAWTPPRTPNSPVENKTETGRIHQVRVISTEPGGNGSGYSDFDLAVYANTTMRNVDPPEHGDVEGEPYFFVWIEDEPIARSRIVGHDDEKLYTLRILPSALEQFDAGSIAVEVALLDEDSEYDDRYDTWNGTVLYDPG